MINTIKKYFLLIICIYVSIVYTSLKFMVDLGIPSQVGTMMVYVPFIICSIGMMFATIQGCKKNKGSYFKQNTDRLILVIVVVYCLMLSLYRFIMQYNYMDGLHFAARIIGAFGVFYFTIDYVVKKQNIIKNLLLFSFFLNVIIILDYIINKTFRQTTVLSNVLIVGSIVLLLDLNSAKYIRDEKDINIGFQIINNLNILITVGIIFLSGSRTMLLMGASMLVFILISLIKNQKQLLWYGGTLILSFLLITFVFYIDFGDSRQIITKQLETISINIAEKEVNQNSESILQESEVKDFEVPQQSINSPTQQMSVDSDNMRKKLWQLGIEEVKKDLLLGTGNVYFEYTIAKGVVQQTSHNFIIESLIAFGLIGTVILIILVIYLFIRLIKNKHILTYDKMLCGFLIIIVFGVSFFQQTLFNYMILLISFLIVASIYTDKKKLD